MFFKKLKSKKWTKKQMRKNLNTKTPIECEQYIHTLDKNALIALKKIPLLDTVCSKVWSVMNDKINNMINMSSMIHITEKQLPKIHNMIKSICNKIGIDMPELYLKLDRTLNASTYGTEKSTIIINSGLLECLEDDELYAVLAHECGHIACKHLLYKMVADIVLNKGTMFGVEGLVSFLDSKGLLGNIAGNIISTVDSALELAFYHWDRCCEFSADRIAVICCGSADPVIETMMRLAGGTTHIDNEINKDLFIEQATEYNNNIEKNLVNKSIEFLLTKNMTHPLLAVRAYEAQKFANSDEFKCIKH